MAEIASNALTKVVLMQADYYTLGSNFPQCTVTQSVTKSTPAVYSPGCAMGLSNSCCNGTNSKACTT